MCSISKKCIRNSKCCIIYHPSQIIQDSVYFWLVFIAQNFEIIFYAQSYHESFCAVVASLIIFGTKTQQWISYESTTWSKQRAVRIFKACTIRQFFSSIRPRSSITKLNLPSTNFCTWTTWSCEWAVRIYLTTKQTIELSSWVSE